MVQTRRQWSAWRDRGFRDTDEEDNHSESSQASTFDHDHYEYDGGDTGEDNAHAGPYRPGDNCHRHRLSDSAPFTEVVTSYRRRKPH